ncbi:MAG: DUF1559 domain-containing protein [Planctomycetota bacterium]|nr:MAG: DUF1559 domain-containing protein [Planctomycetota bacterium]REK25110.1 MAG: DUF1559 domain-containing protein [Planctomycetota bacterium]REK44678.1 MAG: DUF1559 domain-containing protein [Planctomycetota bacterium]
MSDDIGGIDSHAGERPLSGKATASLIFGLTSVFLCLNLFTGVPAIILGILAQGDISKFGYRGAKAATWGTILGIVGIVMIPVLGILAAMTLPAVAKVRAEARSTISLANMRDVTMAFTMYEGQYGHFPPAAGGPAPNQVSWRLELAPYLEMAAVREAYRRDQPWDSDTNQEFVAMIPASLQSPMNPEAASGMTNYLVPVGEETAFPPEGQFTSSAKFRDGVANTILLLEADNELAVPWTEPRDLDYDAQNPLNGLGRLYPGHFHAAFADGRVERMDDDVDAVQFRAMITPHGGEVVPGD